MAASWVDAPGTEAAAVRLFCLPHAGGGASLFRTWQRLVDARVAVCPIRLPGREVRVDEPPITDLDEMVEAILAALVPHIDRPYALFGHSMGGMLAYEVAALARRRRLPEPMHLFVSAWPAPCFERRILPLPVASLSDDDFREHLRRFDPSSTALDNPELRELMWPALRADFALCQGYRDRRHRPFDCPISVFVGADDPKVAASDMKRWAEYTSNVFRLRVFAGDHFFLREPRQVVGEISTTLALSRDGHGRDGSPGTRHGWREGVRHPIRAGEHRRPVRPITAASLGSAAFKAEYGIKYAYLAGSMYKGIASPELVVALGRAGFLGYLGTGGLELTEIESSIRRIQRDLPDDQPYGMNLLCNRDRPELEDQTVGLYLKCGIRRVEASAFTQITPALVRFRLTGVGANGAGGADVPNRILAKVSRPEVAAAFMSPAPTAIVDRLLAHGQLTLGEAALGRQIPMSDELCIEADSAGHTDGGVALALIPAMLALRDEIVGKHAYAKTIHIGAAGGIGTPHAAAAAFAMGADFVLTGSINQCTVEAGTSDAVKELLQQINVQDTAYAPAGDMFETGGRVQVLKRGLFFAARANRLYELYQRYDSLDALDAGTRKQIEKYFGRSLAEVWEETKTYYRTANPKRYEDAERHPKQKMALIFRWYFIHSARLAREGSLEQRVDYQVHCGPALGAFNQWVKGTTLEPWRNRRVAEIAERLMIATAELLTARVASWQAHALLPRVDEVDCSADRFAAILR